MIPREQGQHHARLKRMQSRACEKIGGIDRRKDLVPTEAGQQYAGGVRGALYDEGLACSLDLYKAVTAAHLKTQEAGSPRLQIQNIANAVVQNQNKNVPCKITKKEDWLSLNFAH